MAKGNIVISVKVRWPYLLYALHLIGAKRFGAWLCVRCEVVK